MSKILEPLPLWVLLLILALVTVATQAVILPAGLWLHNSDLMINPLAAEQMLRGHWRPFPFDQDYGGTLLTTLRAFWVFVFELFYQSETSHIPAHLSFSYLAIPTLLSWVYFACARRFCSLSGAFAIGVLTAVNFMSWTQLLGNDFYFSFLLLAPLFFVLRAEVQNPIFELPLQRLFSAAVLSGFSIYTWRASIIYVVAFWTPWQEILPTLRRLLQPRDLLERALLVLTIFFFGFYLYVETFGPDIGTVFGKAVRTHSGPNLRFAFLFGSLSFLRAHGKRIRREHLRRVGLLLGGVLIGFLPEILWFIKMQRLPFNWATASIPQALQSFIFIPTAFEELTWGWNSMSVYSGLTRNASLLLLCLSLLVLIWEGFKKPLWSALLAVAGLSIIAYCRVYMSGPSESRYLFPIFPVVLFSFGALWERAWKNRAWGYGVLGLLLIHGVYQVQHRVALAANVRDTQKIEALYGVIEAFKKAQVKVAISSYYWNSYQYTFITRERFYVVPSYGIRLPAKAFALAASENRVGILIPNGTLDSEVTLLERRFKLTPLQKVGELHLYIGEAL